MNKTKTYYGWKLMPVTLVFYSLGMAYGQKTPLNSETLCLKLG